MTVSINIWDGENYIQLNQRPHAVLSYVFLFQKNSHMWIAAIFNTTKKLIENATQSFKGVRFKQLGNILYRLYPLLPFDIYVGIIVIENGHLFL